jgi:hypothetical protein
MSTTSVKVAFAFVVILAYPAASIARHTVTTAMNNAPIKTIDSRGHAKCVLDRATTLAAPDRAAYSVCWAPEDITDGPGV